MSVARSNLHPDLKSLASRLVLSFAAFWALLFSALALTAPAQATLMQRDLFSAGDNLLAYDSDTNMEWLHFSLTDHMGFVAIQSQLGTLGGGGFRFATFSEVTTLFANAGFSGGGMVIASNLQSDLDAADLMHGLLGTTFLNAAVGSGFTNTSTVLEGWVLSDNPSDPLVYQASVSSARIVFDSGAIASQSASAQIATGLDCDPNIACFGSTFGAGAWLLRAAAATGGGSDIPEPAVLPLLIAPLAWLALRRRRA